MRRRDSPPVAGRVHSAFAPEIVTARALRALMCPKVSHRPLCLRTRLAVTTSSLMRCTRGSALDRRFLHHAAHRIAVGVAAHTFDLFAQKRS